MAGKAPARSAGYVGWGLLLLVGGMIAAAAGLANPSGGIFDEPRKSPWVYAGGVASLLGFALLGIGIHTMAQGLDALTAHLRSSSPAETLSQPPEAPSAE